MNYAHFGKVSGLFLVLNGVHHNLIPCVLLIDYDRCRAAIGECGKKEQQMVYVANVFFEIFYSILK